MQNVYSFKYLALSFTLLLGVRNFKIPLILFLSKLDLLLQLLLVHLWTLPKRIQLHEINTSCSQNIINSQKLTLKIEAYFYNFQLFFFNLIIIRLPNQKVCFYSFILILQSNANPNLKPGIQIFYRLAVLQ